MDLEIKLFILLAVLTDIVFACQSGWYGYGHSCYLPVNHHKETWEGAQTFCKVVGGYLLEISSKGESDFVKGHLYSGRNYFIGLTDIATEGQFEWMESHKNQAYTFADWGPSEPNNYKHDQDCVVMKGTIHFRWSDQVCRDPEYFICERPRYM